MPHAADVNLGSSDAYNRTHLAAIEHAARNPSIRTIVKLATAFRVPFTVPFEPIPLQTEALERRDVAKRSGSAANAPANIPNVCRARTAIRARLFLIQSTVRLFWP